MIEGGIILIKEDAVMCLSTVGEASGKLFQDYYYDTIKTLSGYLSSDEYTHE